MRAEDVPPTLRLVADYIRTYRRYMANGGSTAPVHAALKKIEALSADDLDALAAELETADAE